mgnify:CR=1 FL=1
MDKEDRALKLESSRCGAKGIASNGTRRSGCSSGSVTTIDVHAEQIGVEAA